MPNIKRKEKKKTQRKEKNRLRKHNSAQGFVTGSNPRPGYRPFIPGIEQACSKFFNDKYKAIGVLEIPPEKELPKDIRLKQMEKGL